MKYDVNNILCLLASCYGFIISDYMKSFSNFVIGTVCCAAILWILYFTGLVDITQWVKWWNNTKDIIDDISITWWFIYDLVWSPDDASYINDIDTNDIDSNNMVNSGNTEQWMNYATGQVSVKHTTLRESWSMLSPPYSLSSDKPIEPGVFVLLWTINNKKSLYVYKLKYGWNRGGVANKWVSFSSGKVFLSSLSPHFVDSNGISIETGEILAVDQLVFIEVDTTTTTN